MENQINLYPFLSSFVPNSAGDYSAIMKVTLQAASQTFPFLNHLLDVLDQPKLITIRIEECFTKASDKASAESLRLLFDKYGSDKSTGHNYHHLYGGILKDVENISNILEIGMGTNNLDVVSNMGAQGKPGASLRAFRDFLPHATIFGADVDKRILFQDDRIKTYFVDQTDLSSFEELEKNIPDSMDMIIDDGLHAPNANLAVLAFGLKKLKNNGWLVIEDIPEPAIPIWNVVAALLPSTFSSKLLIAEGGLVFVVQKRG